MFSPFPGVEPWVWILRREKGRSEMALTSWEFDLWESWCQKFSLWSWQKSEKLWPFSRGDWILLTQREVSHDLAALELDSSDFPYIWGWICQSPASPAVLFQPLSWIPRCPGIDPRTVGLWQSRKCWRAALQCVLTGWLDVLGECRRQWKRLFLVLSFFPYPSRRYVFLSFKKADFVEVPQGCLWVQNDHENYLDKKETWPQWE